VSALEAEKQQLNITINKYESLMAEYKAQIEKYRSDLSSESVRVAQKARCCFGLSPH
jgi:hypothetical protein